LKLPPILGDQRRPPQLRELTLEARDPRQHVVDARAALDALADGVVAGEQIDGRVFGDELVGFAAPSEPFGRQPVRGRNQRHAGAE
jgi:hypothetical protein